MKMKDPLKAELQVLKQYLLKLQFLAADLDAGDIKRLEHELGNLEREISALRSFIWNHLMREAENERGMGLAKIKPIQEWTSTSEFSIQVSAEQKLLYKANDPHGDYYAYRWPYLKGRHKGGEFPVVIVRKHFIEQGYKVWVSGLSKPELGMDAFILTMFPGARKKLDQSYLNMVEVFGEDRLSKFISIVDKQKEKYGLPRHGGDPDIFVQNINDPSDRFFVEVKAEDSTGKRRYQDKLNNQQNMVFPLIEKHLKCQVRLAKVQIITV